MRIDQRQPGQLRPVKVTTDYLLTAEGSALIEVGNTRVLCAASVEESVPPFLRGSGKGWVTAEYSMLPRATATRTAREVSKGRASGRTMEIQRLIGRSLRSVIDMDALGERSVILDCDVLQADGGTRTAAITGAYIALSAALRQLVKFGALKKSPIRDFVAATSVGIIGGTPMLDLCYSGGLAGRGRHERGDDRLRENSSKCKPPPRRPRSTTRSWPNCWRWRGKGSANWWRSRNSSRIE